MADDESVIGKLFVNGLAVAGSAGLLYMMYRSMKSNEGHGRTSSSAGPARWQPGYIPHDGGAMSTARGYSTNTWIPSLTLPAMQNNVPLSFAVAWEGEESGGNPCAIGSPHAKGPDGNPQEMGIMQIYNPDDLQHFGVKGSDLRAYCSSDPNNLQQVTRDLTEAEIAQQADLLIKMIVKSRAVAQQYLNLAGAHWSPDGRDFWCMVKLVHGLPGLVHGLMNVAAFLKRAPTSWAEFRSTIEHSVKVDPRTEAYRNDPPHRINFSDIFNNAEKAAAGVTGPNVA